MTRVQKTIRNLTDIFLKEQTEILKAATLLMVPSLLTKVTGQIVVVLMATRLGTGRAIEEFNLANTIPEALLNILLLGVVGVVVIPIFVESKEKEGVKRFLRIYSTVANGAVGLFILASLGLILTSSFTFPWLLDNVIRPAPGEYPSPDSIRNVIEMMNFLMLPNLILAASVMVSSGLNVYNRFLVPQLAPLFYNVGRIFSVVILLPLMSDSPWALVLGVLIGSVMHLLIQLPLARYVGLKYLPVLDLSDDYVRRLFRISIPRGVAFAAENLGLTVLRLLASGLGAISVFNYANSLALVIPALFGYTFGVASMPKLSSMYTRGEHVELGMLVPRTLNQIFFLSMPFAVTLIVLRLPIVRLVYGLFPGTAFDREATAAVAWTLLFFAIGILFETGRWYAYRLFYVAKNTIIPLGIGLASLVITVLFSIWMTNLFSHSDLYSLGGLVFDPQLLLTRGEGRAAIGGLAFAFSLASVFELIALLYLANRLVVKLDFRLYFKGLARMFVPSIVMGGLMYAMYKTWDSLAFPIDAGPEYTGSTTLNLAVLTIITVATSFMVYYLLSFLFRIEDLRILKRFLNPLFRLGGITIH